LIPTVKIFRLKCRKFNFRWGFAPDSVGKPYRAPPNPQLYLEGRRGRWRERKVEWKRMGKGEKGRGGASPNILA